MSSNNENNQGVKAEDTINIIQGIKIDTSNLDSNNLSNPNSLSSQSSQSSEKRNNNLDAYFSNNTHKNKLKLKSPLYTSNTSSPSSYSGVDRNSKVLDYLNTKKVNSSESEAEYNANEENDIDDVLEEKSEQPQPTSDYESEVSDNETEVETESILSTSSASKYKNESIRFTPLTKYTSRKSSSININKKLNQHDGYMSLPVEEELSRSTTKGSLKDYSKSIDDWALSYKKTFNTKMEAMTMTYSELPPSLKAYRKQIKNRKKNKHYAEEEGLLDNNYESVMNYGEETTTADVKPVTSSEGDQITEVIELSNDENNQNNQEASETDLLIPKPEDYEQKSTFTQSCFNSVNVLMGIGIISFPFSFYLTGWVLGVFMFIFFALLTMHTAKILGKCMKINNLTNYSEIGYAAFGKKGYVFISILFSLELFACSVSLVILIADSLVALFPELNNTMVKIVSFFLITPLTYPKHLGALAWGSLIGIFAIANLATILFYDGFSKPDAPGSLIEPAVTHLLPVSLMRVPLTIGILMAGFSGHSVFPSIYHDMRDPSQYNSVVHISYALTFGFYIIIAAVGYAMFGEGTLPEITQNIAEIPVYSRFVNRLTIWLMVINPITKYGVDLIPLNANVEQICAPLVEDLPSSVREIIRLSNRTFISFLVVFVAIVFPEFHQVLCVLGSLFSMIICVIFPCMCYHVLYKGLLSPREVLINKMVIAVSAVIAVIGTVWAFIPNII